MTEYNRIIGVTPDPSYVPTQIKLKTPKTKIFRRKSQEAQKEPEVDDMGALTFGQRDMIEILLFLLTYSRSIKN